MRCWGRHRTAVRVGRGPIAVVGLCVVLGWSTLSAGSTGRSLPAFPGAQGFGARTRGGRGGRVIEVTNLDDAGPGSLRAAIEADGPRTIVFRVGGMIVLGSHLRIKNPWVTIAGQTAPGDGICIRKWPLLVQTSEVIIRGLRHRLGDDPDGPKQDQGNGICVIGSLTNHVRNVILDHCSVSWAWDENLDAYYAVSDVTFQWCIISEALHRSRHPKGPHSMGMLLGGHDGHSTRMTVHHCLFAHNNGRNPLVSTSRCATEIINNVIYNWGMESTCFEKNGNAGDPWTGPDFKRGPHLANVIGNFYKPGPDSRRKGIIVEKAVLPESTIYLKGNIGPGRTEDQGDEWDVVKSYAGTNPHSSIPAFEPSGVTVQPVTRAYELVLARAGAAVPHRDAVDERVIQSVRDGTGRIIDSLEQVGGHPVYRGGEAPPDTDHDGMLDDWEKSRGLDPNDPEDRNLLAPSGYTWVEEYINSLLP